MSGAGISVVIPAYGQSSYLAGCLASIHEQTLKPLEVIVFHSGPGDPADDLAARFPNVQFLHEDARHFPGAARNAGAKVAVGEWIAFLDSDMIASSGWLDHFSCAISGNPTEAFCGSIGRVDTGGLWSRVMWFIECGSVLPHRRPIILRSGPGANMVLRRSEFLDHGGFREDLLAGEDGDLVARLAASGVAFRLAPSARADHAFPGGARHSLKRLSELGRAAASLRKTRELPGSSFVRHPLLILALPLVRMSQMAIRLIFERGPILHFLALSPLIVVGLSSWSYGFWEEATSSDCALNGPPGQTD